MRLQNVYDEHEVYVWARLDFDGLHLDMCECTCRRFGEVPRWWEEELSHNGIDVPISKIWNSVDDGIGGSFSESWLIWALQEGIAPYQPFLLRISEPRYYRCSYEYDEWDCEWDWEIVKIYPFSQEMILQRWKKLIEELKEGRAAYVKRTLEIRERRKTDTSAMFLKYDYYWTRYYDDMSLPDGIILRLCSDYPKHSHAVLIEARDPDGRRETVMNNLVDEVKKKLPHLDEQFIRSLRVGYP